jgi:hypothetical protein
VYVANDTDDNYLYLNRSKNSRELALDESGLLVGVARDDRGIGNGSMGVDAADFDRSGRASIVVTNYEGELPALYQNRTDSAAPRFNYATLTSGMAVIGGRYVGWGLNFADFDHDGWEDLAIVNGHAIRFPTKVARSQKAVLLGNDRGKFKPMTERGGSYFQSPHNARGTAVGDLDNDGKPDLVISHLNEPVAVLRNIAPENRHWVGIELEGERHRSTVGTRIEIESASGKQVRYIKGGASFGSSSDRRHCFGLGGDSTIHKVTVHWSHGETQEYSGSKPGSYWRLTQGRSRAEKIEYHTH